MVFGSAWLWLGSRFGLLLLLPVLAGCGSDQNKVSGRVKFDGKPLPGGLVTFQPTDPQARAVTTFLDEEGNYEVVLPRGEVRISVDNRELAPRGPGSGGMPPDLPPGVKNFDKKAQPKPPEVAPTRPPGKYVAIPEPYYEIESAGLTYLVEPGEQKHDIELLKVPKGK
jgi:hypothetical protein